MEAKKGGKVAAKAPLPPQRNPLVATVLAVFPGIAIHGAGHMYAGSWMKGVALFALEGASVYLLYDGYRQYERGDFDNITKNNGTGIPSNLGVEYQEAGIALVSLTGWGATWVDDVIGAHFAAKQFNEVHEQDATTVSLRLQPRPDGAVLALSSTF
jgi:TM2 domain-containing membrane protein YozV